MRRAFHRFAAAFVAVLALSGGAEAGRVDVVRSIDFEAAIDVGGALAFEGGRVRALGPMDLGPAWAGVSGGGSLGLADVGDGFGAVTGAALSTRDLSWPYGFIIEFESAASAASAAWAAGGVDWSIQAVDSRGGVLAETVVEAGATRFELGLDDADLAEEGFSSLLFRSLGGYDWIYVDSLAWAERAPVQNRMFVRRIDREVSAEVPLPAAFALMGSAVGALGLLAAARAGRGRSRRA